MTTETEELLAGLPERIGHVIRDTARLRPGLPALIDATTTWSYGEFAEIVGELAATMKRLGIRGGDRVAIVSENSLPLAALVLATSENDAWAVVVNPRLSPREVDQIRDHSGARRVFFVTHGSEAAREHADRQGAESAELGRTGRLAIGPLNEAAEPEPVFPEGAHQVAALMYTSGTTGNPKGVMLSHRNLLYNAAVSGKLRRISTDDCLYGVLPMSHIVGLSNILLGALMFGAAVRVAPRYAPEDFERAIVGGEVTVVYGVPATYQRLLEHMKLSGRTTLQRGRLRYIAVAGAPLDLSLRGRTEQALGLPMLNSYGITECGPAISGMREESEIAGVSVGQRVPGIELRVVRPDGDTVEPGEVGELRVRGPGVMLGYYRAPELTAAAIDEAGWFNTGDLARVDGDYLYVVGRTKELIIRSGFNVYPPEVEAVLNSHPEVVQSAVVGRAVEGNEEVIAYVQLTAGARADAAALMDYASARLTAYKRPSRIVALESLPASSTGKILKHRLADAAR
jgi:acyl-CoA synthetase (AMP-forming)/AMP-acid ligase II